MTENTKKTINWLSKRWFNLSCLLVIVVLLGGLGIRISDRDTTSRQSRLPTIGAIGDRVITLGSEVEAAGSVDYSYGVANVNVQFQTALNALPATGGRLVDISAVNKNWAALATVTRAIDNVIIEGSGRGSYFVGDGVTSPFTAGGNNWRFSNIRVNVTAAIFLAAMGATTGWTWDNVATSDVFFDHRSPSGQSRFNDVTATSVTDSGLTDGRIPIAGTGGLLGDSSNLTFSNGFTVATTANITTLNSATGRTSVKVVAGSDTLASIKAQADYIADGTNDETTIQAAITDVGNNADFWTKGLGTVKLIGTFYIDAADVIEVSNSLFTLDASDALLIVGVNGAGNIVNVERPALSQTLNRVHVKIDMISAKSGMESSFTGNVIRFSGVSISYLQAEVFSFNAATALSLDSTGGVSVENNLFDLVVRDCARGVVESGNGSTNYNYFQRFSFNVESGQPPGNTGYQNNGPSGNYGISFGLVDLWLKTNDVGINTDNITHIGIDRLNVEHTSDNSSIAIKGNTDTVALNINVAKFYHDGATASAVDIQRNGIRSVSVASDPGYSYANSQIGGKVVRLAHSGFTTNLIGGGSTQATPADLVVATSVTVNSTASVYTAVRSLGGWYQFDWSKRLAVSFVFMRSASDAEVTGFVQLKSNSTTAAVLNQPGIGINFADMALSGETYKAARSTVDLSTTVTDLTSYHVNMVLTPGVSVEYYINGILAGTITTNIPTVIDTNDSGYVVFSILNGPTGGTNARALISNFEIWQEN